MKVARLTAVLLGVVVALTLPSALGALEGEIDFTGTWQLNQELSENPRDKMRESMGARGGFGGGSGGGRGGGRGGGSAGGMNGGFGGRGGEDSQERTRAMQESFETLTIAHEEPEIRVTFADDREQLVYTDGRKVDGLYGETEATWKKGGQLVVKTKSDRGKRTETWELSEDGNQLLLTTEMPGRGPMPSMSFRRIYDKVASVEAATAD